MSETHCGHGISYDAECIECGLLWERDVLARLEARVIATRAAIKKLEAKQAKQRKGRVA